MEIWNGEAYRELTSTYRNRRLCLGCNMRKPGARALSWQELTIAPDGTHHVDPSGEPAYGSASMRC
jgi:hypothetical protein